MDMVPSNIQELSEDRKGMHLTWISAYGEWYGMTN